MGKNKKKTRSKLRPSSSRHSAELLSSAGATAPPGLIGFQNYPVETACLGTPAGNLEEEGNATVRVIVKTMLKKDVVTKLKGIQEFITFCTDDKENSKLFLPYFPRIYNKLAMETNVSVREAIQKALEMYIPMLKRDIAPYLKSIMATWLITQCDPYVGAARAAQYAFWKSFPSHKQSDAVMFCQSEILQAINNNLCEANADSVNEAGLTEDACGERYEFILICSVRGLKLFINLLSKGDKQKVVQPISCIVRDKRFWAHSHSTVSKIREAWYELLYTLTLTMPEVFQETRHLISLVVSSLWKDDPQVLRSIWDCAFQVFSTFKDWWKQIDVSSMVLAPLFEFLSLGGFGNAVVIYPKLKEFLRHLMVVDDVALGFFVQFFNCIRESFSLEKLKSSPKDCDAVMKAFVPCLKLVNTMYIKLGALNCIKDLLERQLIPVLCASWTSEGSHISATSFYSLLGLYFYDLEVCRSPTDSPDYDSYSCILTFIWDRMLSEMIRHLSMEQDVGPLVFFFHCLYHPGRCLDENEVKMNFGSETSMSVNTYSMKSRSLNILSRRWSSISSESSLLLKYTVELCKHLCVELEKNLKRTYLDLLTELFCEASSYEMFIKLLEALNVQHSSTVDAPFSFFKNVIMDWMQKASNSCDAASINCIAELIICICFCVNTETAIIVLDLCSMVEHQQIFQRLVLKILGSVKAREECFLKWFHSLTFGCTSEFMTTVFTRKLMYERLNEESLETSLCRRTLMLCFTKAGSEQPKILWTRIQQTISYFTYILSDEHCVNYVFQEDYNIIDFICDAAEKLLFEHPSVLLSEAEIAVFVLKVFTLSLEWAKFSFPESHKEQQQLDNLWKTYLPYAVTKQSDLNERNFLVMAAHHLHDLLLKEMPKQKQKCVTDTTYKFLSCVEQYYSDMSVNIDDSVLLFLIKKILPTTKEWEEARNGLHMGTVMLILKGYWFYPFVNDHHLPLCTVSVPPLLFVADAVVELLRRIWDLMATKCTGQIQGVYHKLLCSKYLPHLLFAVCYSDMQNFFKCKDEVEPTVFSSLQENFSYLMGKCNMYQLVSVLFFLLLQDELTWCIPFETVMQAALKETMTPMDYFKTSYSVFEQYRSSYLTLTQVYLKYSAKELVGEFLNSINEDFFNVVESRFLPTSGTALCAFVSQLAGCVQEHGLKFASVTREKVVHVLEKLARSEWFRQYDHDGDPLLVTCFTSVAVGVLKDARKEITSDLWVLLIQITTGWFQRCLTIRDTTLRCSSSLIFLQKTCTLIGVMSEVTQEADKEGDVQAYGHWKMVFGSDVSKELVKLFLHFAGKISDLGHTSSALETLLFALVQALEYLSAEQIFEVLCTHSKSPSSVDLCTRIDSAYEVLQDLAQYLKSRSICVQFGMYFILKKVLLHLLKIDQRHRSFDNAENENIFKSLPLVELLAHTTDVVEMLLTDVKPTECCSLNPFTDSYTYTMANLLAWNIFLEYLSASVAEERSVYVGCLADSKMLSCMLMNVIRLRPENPSACSDYMPKKKEQDEFNVDLHEIPPLYSLGTPSSKHLQHVACSVYVAALKKIPVLVRTWWSNLDMKTGDIVEKFTSENISKVLILNEINGIHCHRDNFTNMTVDAYASSRQVTATYTLDDALIELSIKISQNYPLGPVLTSTKRKNIVDSNKWRTLMFHLSTSLNYHNGSIKDGLLLWKKNLDKMFEGVEECMICYFILHSSSGTIPDKTCRLCKKKFHGSCLFKWFKSSNSCSCPGCRNIF